MRSDFALYVVAIICLILAAVVLAGSVEYVSYLQMDMGISIVITAVLVILGLISAGAGYLVRPEKMVPAPPARPAPKPSALPPAPPPKITITPPIEITEVRGIGPTRAERLRALGINTAQDLARTTATSLAAKTGLSPKITRRWVREAKRLIKEAA